MKLGIGQKPEVDKKTASASKQLQKFLKMSQADDQNPAAVYLQNKKKVRCDDVNNTSVMVVLEVSFFFLFVSSTLSLLLLHSLDVDVVHTVFTPSPLHPPPSLLL